MVRRAYHHGNLRRALLDAALARLSAGSDEFTLRELARDVDVTHNAPYRHFAGKAEILEALRAEGFELLAVAAREARDHAGEGTRARVRALGEAYVRFALQHPQHFRLMLENPLGAPEEAGKPGEAFVLLQQTLEEGRARGDLRDDLGAKDLAIAAWALVHGLASLLASGRLPAHEARLHRWVKLLDATFFDGVTRR